MMTGKPVQHGESLLVPIEKAPKGEFKKVKSAIVAHSETGHNHVVLADKLETFEQDGVLYLKVESEGATLIHQKETEKHATQPVHPGTYKVNLKTEYDPWTKAIRAVQD